MGKIQRISHCLMILCVLLGLNAQPLRAMAQQNDLIFNQPAPVDAIHTNWKADQSIPDTYALVAENDQFQLYGNKTTLAFKVVDKRSGYVWNSNLDTVGEDDQLNKTWTAFATSGFSIDYLDQKADTRRASITNSNHTIDFKTIDQGFQASVTFSDVSITVGITVKLEAQGVSVEIPFASIKEADEKYKLGLVYVYPFFAATKGDSIPGYMFIPDGAGSLIPLSSATKAKNMFYGKYYGADLGMITEMPWDPTINRPFRLSIPVYGMVHGEKQNAFISIVEKGASYGELQAHPAGIITKFNFLYDAFLYNESYFQKTNRSGDGVTILQHKTNIFDVKIHYRFLTKDDSDYVGMAKSYQRYLIENGILKKVLDSKSNIGIKLEFLAGEKQRILFWDQFISMTTIGQMDSILKDLNIPDADVVYYGWQPLGASSMPPNSLKLEGKLGSLGALSQLVKSITSGGGNFYLYLDPQAALYGEGGYSPRNDLAMSITNVNLIGYNREVNYYFNLNTLNARFTSLSKDVTNKLKTGFALDGIGWMLYSDFKNNHFLNREDAIRMYQKLLAGSSTSTSFYTPNDYMFADMKAYYDMPLTDSGYLYTSGMVPFLQIVFAGYVPFYGPALNFTSNAQQDLLRQVDFNVYPSYFLSNDITAKILNTNSSWIYTSSYSQWGQEIKRSYQWLNNLLGPVKGAEIIARQVLQEGVVATTYSNGKQIVVNYNESPYSSGDITVNSLDAVIRQVVP